MPKKSIDPPDPTSSLFFNLEQTEIRNIPLEQIQVPQDPQARNATKSSIEALGCIQTVLLSKIGEDRYQLHDGKSRYHSALEQGLTEIPAIVVEGNAISISLAKIALNTARRANPVDEAREIKSLFKVGFDVASIAQSLGISTTTLKKRIKLLELPDLMLEGIGENISLGVAEKIANMAAEYREKALERYLVVIGEGKKFAHGDLKDTQIARSEDRAEVLEGSPQDTLFSKLELAVTTVESICETYGVDVPMLLEALNSRYQIQTQAPEPTPRSHVGTRQRTSVRA